MSFVHADKDFEQLLAIVARDTGISEALIEKDYWVTHTLWALHSQTTCQRATMSTIFSSALKSDGFLV